MQTIPAISWNVVARHFRVHEPLQAKLRQKIRKLEKHLKRFPPDAVHLQVVLEKHPKRDLFTAALTLRLPSNILSAGKSAPDPIPAFDHAVKALLRELATLKDELRHKAAWKRRQRPVVPEPLEPVRFAPEPLPPGQGPQNLRDLVADLLRQLHNRLIRYVRRQVAHDEATGELPAGAVDPPAVVDEVARRALTAPQHKPDRLGYLLWFYALAREELERRRKAFRLQARQMVPLDPLRLVEDEEAAEPPSDADEAQPASGRVASRDAAAPATTETPDEAAARKELLEHLQVAARAWPKPERDFFELYFLEGFEPHDIAMILRLPPAKAEELLASVQARLREELLRLSAL